MDSPPQKLRRIRTCACNCPACNGQERDHRTIQRHAQPHADSVGPTASNPPDSTSNPVSNPPNSASNLPGSNANPASIPPSSASIPPSSALNPPSSASNPPSSALNPPSSASNPPNSALNPLSSASNPPGSNSNPSSNPPGSASNPPGSNSNPTSHPVFSRNDLTTYVLRETLIKLELGHSQSEITEHLRNTSQLLGVSALPGTWKEVLQMLRQLGYTSPRHYKVCCNDDHSYLLLSKGTHPACPLCSRSWGDCIDYYVVGLKFQDWFLTNNQCEALLGHWEDRDTWLDVPPDFDCPEKSELWHGKRFQELSYFWNPEATSLLPERCPSCSSIITKAEISANISGPTPQVATLICKHCCSLVTIAPQYMKGDPRNQAVIIHEDGWAPHNTSAQHSVAAITITHACMTKVERANSKHAKVFSFIPVSQLPRDSPHKYDAFLQPLIEELIDLYVDGCEVFFKSAVEDFSPPNDTPKLRVLPLLLTADLRAHAEIGLTSAGGFKGCRRCHVEGEYIPLHKHYYYGSFQQRFRFPAVKRTAESNRVLGKDVDSAATEAERKRRAKQGGVTGESILFQLYDLCGFDPVQDLVVDVMHSLTLNLIRSELEHHLLKDNDTSSLDVAGVRRGLLERRELAEALGKVDWYMELRDGRVPRVCPTEPSGKHKLGHWKAEEFAKFAIVAPYVLRELIPVKAYQCFCILSTIYKLVYSMELRIQGWSTEHQQFLNHLMWKHHILYESLYGLSACTENVEYSTHMVEDISRHSTPDNYWCYMYERQVKYYKRQTTNMKTLCKTFADRAAQLHFVQTYLDCNTPPIPDSLEVPSLRDIASPPILLQAKSVEEATRLKQFLSSQDLPQSIAQVYKAGIVLGTPHFITLSDRQLHDIHQWLTRFNPNSNLLPNLPQVAQTYTRVLHNNDYDLATVYRKNEHVIISDYDQPQEWVMQISAIIVYGPVCNKYYHFLDGNYYVAKTSHGEAVIDPWTKQPIMVKRHFELFRVYPLQQLLRKVMLFPDRRHHDHFLTIDPDGPLDICEIKIPYFPTTNEVVEFQEGDQTKLMRVIEVAGSCVRGIQLRKVRGSQRWVPGDRMETLVLNCIRRFDYSINCGHILLNTHSCP